MSESLSNGEVFEAYRPLRQRGRPMTFAKNKEFLEQYLPKALNIIDVTELEEGVERQVEWQRVLHSATKRLGALGKAQTARKEWNREKVST